MAIQDEMYRLIEKEISKTVEKDKHVLILDYEKAKQVALMLTYLSTESRDADELINQYIVNIKNICNP